MTNIPFESDRSVKGLIDERELNTGVVEKELSAMHQSVTLTSQAHHILWWHPAVE